MRPISFGGRETLSFRQIDEMNGLRKGETFRIFKQARDRLDEGSDYYYLPASQYPDFIEQLRAEGRIYASTVHLVLITRDGYARLRE